MNYQCTGDGTFQAAGPDIGREVNLLPEIRIFGLQLLLSTTKWC